MIPTIELLAIEFSQALRSYLTHEEMTKIIRRNKKQTCQNICHSHDFCDANIVLHEVFMRHDMDIVDEGGVGRWGTLWDGAWSLAKSKEFQFNDALANSRKRKKPSRKAAGA